MHLRRKLVAGNWKMNGSIAQLAELPPIAEAARAAGGVDVAVCPPFTLIAPALTRSGGLTIGSGHAKLYSLEVFQSPWRRSSAATIRWPGGSVVTFNSSLRR